MATADVAVLGGCSAGGLGALTQCDHFAALLPGDANAAAQSSSRTSVPTQPPPALSLVHACSVRGGLGWWLNVAWRRADPSCRRCAQACRGCADCVQIVYLPYAGRVLAGC